MARPPLWQREGYRSEYAYRTRGLSRGTEAFQRAAGKRGPARYQDALRSSKTATVTVRGKYSDQIIARVTDVNGRTREYFLQRRRPDTPAGERRSQRRIEQEIEIMEREIPDYDVSVSP